MSYDEALVKIVDLDLWYNSVATELQLWLESIYIEWQRSGRMWKAYILGEDSDILY